MNPTHIEHIGIAVRDLQASLSLFERLLGSRCYAVEEIPDQKVRTAFFKVGQTKIELLEPTAPESAIAKFIEKKGEGIHHIAFAVPDLPASLAELRDAGTQLIDAQPRAGAEGFRIAFLHPKSTNSVLVELCSTP
jgi:methylmalonyl-CoA/ethylmalonyl-CoA epimerase